MSEPTKCTDCGDELYNGGTDGRCRDCDLDHIAANWPKCEECGARLYSDVAKDLGLVEEHMIDCARRPRRVLVCGSRHWTDVDAIREALATLPRHSVVIHGGCPSGADALADIIARRMKIAVDVFPADWKAHGKAAGPIRNAQMIASKPDLVLAFPLDDSVGTIDTMRRAARAGIEVRTFNRELALR